MRVRTGSPNPGFSLLICRAGITLPHYDRALPLLWAAERRGSANDSAPDTTSTLSRASRALMFSTKRLISAVARFAGTRVIVVGDLITDEYLYGKPARISREAPVLILRFAGREVRLGGAA